MTDNSITGTIAKAGKNAGAAAAETFHDSSVAARKTAGDLGMLADAVAADTKAGVRQLTHAAKDSSSRFAALVRESVQERPNMTVGIAAGVGILLGIMLSGRR